MWEKSSSIDGLDNEARVSLGLFVPSVDIAHNSRIVSDLRTVNRGKSHATACVVLVMTIVGATLFSITWIVLGDVSFSNPCLRSSEESKTG